MIRKILLGPAACLLLLGCATYGGGMTKQQVADNYFSCVMLEASRNNETLTEIGVLAASSRCHEQRFLYARVLVLEQGIPERYADFNTSSFMLPDLEAQTISTFREAGLIK